VCIVDWSYVILVKCLYLMVICNSYIYSTLYCISPSPTHYLTRLDRQLQFPLPQQKANLLISSIFGWLSSNFWWEWPHPSLWKDTLLRSFKIFYASKKKFYYIKTKYHTYYVFWVYFIFLLLVFINSWKQMCLILKMRPNVRDGFIGPM
jgi:hypothetical protein